MVQLESAFLPIPVKAAPWLNCPLPGISFHPTISPTLKVAYTTFASTHIFTHPSPLFSTIGNPEFLLNLSDPVLLGWSDQGHLHVPHFIHENSWISLYALNAITDPGPLGFWRTIQLRNSHASLHPHPPSKPGPPGGFMYEIWTSTTYPLNSVCCVGVPLRGDLPLPSALIGKRI